MKSLKQLAAEVVPQDVVPEELHNDIAVLVKYNRITTKTCKHVTQWTCQRGKISGAVTYTCGCSEEWCDGKWSCNLEFCSKYSVCSECLCLKYVRGWPGLWT